MSAEILIRDQLSSVAKGRTRPARDLLVWPEQFAKDSWGRSLAVGMEFLTWDREFP